MSKLNIGLYTILQILKISLLLRALVLQALTIVDYKDNTRVSCNLRNLSNL